MHKRLLTILVLALSMLPVAVVAQAQEADLLEVDFVANGDLWAHGHGKAVIRATGVVNMRVEGLVIIRDFAGDARIVILDGPDDGLDASDDAPGTKVTLPGFSGHLRVRGSDFVVKALGTMTFIARGEGTVFLEGRGHWHGGTVAGTWSGVRIKYGL